MAYHLYHTEAVVLWSVDGGESNRFYALYTRDLGLVWALAQGVRELKSKLHGHLRQWRITDVTLVRGRALWRLTSAQEHAAGGGEGAAAPSTLGAAARISKLIQRLVHGEGPNYELYQELSSAFHFLHSCDFLIEDLDVFEIVCATRILAHLGYGDVAQASSAITGTAWSNEVLERAKKERASLIRTINTALAASQL